MDLSSVLPEGLTYTALCFRTNAYQCKPLLISREKPLTLKVKHMFLLLEKESNVIIFGIEVYVYLTFHGKKLERHVFILKADTTGLGNHRISMASVTKCFLRYLISINPKVYLDKATYRSSNNNHNALHSNELLSTINMIIQDLRAWSRKLKQNPHLITDFLRKDDDNGIHPSSDLPVIMPVSMSSKISLFTRSADAYLFPESQNNKGKHNINGNTLFKWWISILKDTLDQSWVCKVDIPGSDHVSVRKFLPEASNWDIGNIHVSDRLKDRAVYTIPLLPDDPKGRFLEHLIVENRYKSLTTKQFWNELGFRQEFRLGNVVGIIGCFKECESLEGTIEDPRTSLLRPRQYKKIREVIKGENYNQINDVLNLWSSGIPELAARLKLSLRFVSILGTLSSVDNVDHGKENLRKVLSLVNVLNVKKKSAPVNNLNTLVKRKKTQ
ncbi:H3K56 histone acetylation protein [Metschnikowia bicuspidata var. bicuspidata NRRL YB-4993]|uniref:histone acetyltransferase n=1 Tax=Metschnikowia bicuspidata var. bicuspidata NRRL YB-4993 TaxID=869754 RepID=A0A1A0HBB3_9ASCO|nr:H3K56 histone acetylation protein [Metschnikowia bicuspidata var. bicuspidata NRRL YB-4993]OBA21167.1 H3K56 histone acetylation protein [Metschnikowia bicuspidata var. bicuspidata NRRL YB-4993]